MFIVLTVLALAFVGFSVAGGLGAAVHGASGGITPDSSPWWGNP